MFTIEELEAKCKEMAMQIEQSAANHHVLLGSKATWDSILMEAKKVADMVAIVDPSLAPEIKEGEVISAEVEAALNAVSSF